MSGKQTAKVKKVIDALGLRPFSEKELNQMASDFKKDLQKKMTGKESSLLMIPTYLKPLEPDDLPIGKKVLSISIGGSTIRAALIEVGTDGKDLFFQTEFPKKNEFSNAKEFWNLVVGKLPKEILEKPDALALIWGFAPNTIETPYGIDAAVSKDRLAKDITIPGISQTSQPLGKQLLEALAKKISLEKIPIVVANDTAAIAVAVAKTKIAVVNGTGYNMAVAIGKLGKFYNLEAGGFNKIQQNQLDKIVDEKSSNPGNHLAEKQISGLYLSSQLKIAVKNLIEHGLPIHLKKELSAPDLNILLSEEKNKITELIESDLAIVLREIANTLRERSAGALGTYLGATINTLSGQFPPDQIVKVAFDGSVIRSLSGYREIAKKYAAKVCARNIQFADGGKYADLVGAGTAALSKIP